MLVQPAKDQLDKTIRQFLDEGRMFTAYDVTLETRKRENVNMRHSLARNDIHANSTLSDAIDFGYSAKGVTTKWLKSQIPVGNGNWAFLFHPEGTDANNYVSNNSTSSSNVVNQSSVGTAALISAAVNAVDDSISDSGGANDDGTFSADYRNRLFIRTQFVKHLNLQAGDEVFLYAKQNTLLVSATSIDGLNFISKQKIESNGDFRISGGSLRSAGLNGSKFVIETEPSLIKITDK